ncbi:hypothetical protein FSP39_001672 [Pinctada imbricata]|uniref:NACHT domain-containing protein n=1 Tax=Pinctada imbricata TaxID=66713 RepID=A0AA88XYI1_PINIB|nr:hypothetical protein FSP39_001672 [Pinctada imbricata]
MATSADISTEESTNIKKVNNIIIGPCTCQLRDVLRHRIRPEHFSSIINTQSAFLPSSTRRQLKSILPENGRYTGNYDEMDISLLYTLLRNICNIKPHGKGWGKNPNPEDDSLSASIERIRKARNSIIHSSNLSTESLDCILETIKSAVKDMDKYLNNENKYEKDVENICKESSLIEDKTPDVDRLKQRLIEIHNLTTRNIPVAGVENGVDQLPIEQLFSSVVIQEDHKETRKRNKSKKDNEQNSEERKEVKSPDDILLKNGKPVSRIFMLGKAAHGKTTYCMWLLSNWCKALQPCSNGGSLGEWAVALSRFDFVFLLQFRHVDKSMTNVTEMICQDISGTDSNLQTAVKYVLSSDRHSCLVIMDGLDEWKPDEAVMKKLKFKGMPNIDNMSNCLIFTTMRPWRFSDVERFVLDNDLVIEILGLDDTGIEAVIEKVLENFYGLKRDTVEYEAKCREIKTKLKDETMRSFIKIPLLAVVCVQLWYEDEDVGDTMASFYVAMANMMIERAIRRNQTQNPREIQPNAQVIPANLMSMLSSKKYMYINSNIDVLIKFGMIAYDGLTSPKDMKLVFERHELEKDLSYKELQFGLDVGLISEREAPSIMTRKTRIQFLHKSVQEVLASIHILTMENGINVFCANFSDVETIMELSNVITFICGMCPSLANVILQRVVSVANDDIKISWHRKLHSGQTPALGLFKLQALWYRELQKRDEDNQITFYVSDISIDEYSDKGTIDMTRLILSNHYKYLKCLYLIRVPTNTEHGISNVELNNFLSNSNKTVSLISLSIADYFVTDRFVHPICIPTLKVLHLNSISIRDRILTSNIQNPFLMNMPALQELELWHMNLGDRDMGLNSEMINIQTIRLSRVKMTKSGWGQFVRSLMNINHKFSVMLVDTDIDQDSKETICRSPHINVLKNGLFREMDHDMDILMFDVHYNIRLYRRDNAN